MGAGLSVVSSETVRAVASACWMSRFTVAGLVPTMGASLLGLIGGGRVVAVERVSAAPIAVLSGLEKAVELGFDDRHGYGDDVLGGPHVTAR